MASIARFFDFGLVQLYSTNHREKASYIAAPAKGQAKVYLLKVAVSLRLALATQRSDALDILPVGALAPTRE